MYYLTPVGCLRPGTIGTMTELRKRLLVGILGAAMAFGLVACDSDDEPSITTAPGGTETTEPVGS